MVKEEPSPDPPAGDDPPASPRAPGTSADADFIRCDLCGAIMYARHCRLVCPRCGYQRDCSDP